MRTNILLFLLSGLLLSHPAAAQQDSYLRELTTQVINLRVPSTNKKARNNAVLALSATGKPKITLMDDAHRHPNEYRSNGSNLFQMNKVVTHVYNRQNIGMTSRGDYFNSTESGIRYSAIEKSVPRGSTVSYTINGHVGKQEFVFVPYHSNTKFTATVCVNGGHPISATPLKGGALGVTLPQVGKQDTITFTISNAASNKSAFDSFVILNHNPQK